MTLLCSHLRNLLVSHLVNRQLFRDRDPVVNRLDSLLRLHRLNLFASHLSNPRDSLLVRLPNSRDPIHLDIHRDNLHANRRLVRLINRVDSRQSNR